MLFKGTNNFLKSQSIYLKHLTLVFLQRRIGQKIVNGIRYLTNTSEIGQMGQYPLRTALSISTSFKLQQHSS